MRDFRFVPVVLLSLFVVSCERKVTMNNNSEQFKQVTTQEWDNLANKRIFFGHQSVGYNILEGIGALQKEVPALKLTVKETALPEDVSAPILAHSPVGKNTDPVSKCNDFKRIMDGGIGKNIDLAGFKFCYIDVKSGTDVEILFKYYTETIDSLQAKYPNVRFMHFTVPLTSAESGLKARVKRLLKKPLWDDDDNVQRGKFNRLLIEKYGDTKTVFDIAGSESVYPDGSKYEFSRDGQNYSVLIPAYASDEGHLNADGQKVVGERFVRFLLAQ